MLGKKILIIGGSIAGCTCAILLRRLGADVTILERSRGLTGLGSGISLPESIVKECIEQDLFDSTIPQLKLNGRSFIRRDEQSISDQATFWTQELRVLAFNWADVYANLRKRIPLENYHVNSPVCAFEKTAQGYQIFTANDKVYTADFIIAADGVDSDTRTKILPDSQPLYAGYVAWRGLVDHPDLVNDALFNEHTPYYVFPDGHLLLYRVPGPNYQTTGQSILSWTLYENRQGLPLSELLIDKEGKQHSRSLPAGTLSQHHIDYLHALAIKVLPPSAVKYVIQTPHPFINAIFDCYTPPYLDDHLIFVGDAATTLRPHSGSGVFRALANGLELEKMIKNNPNQSLGDYGTQWKNNQVRMLSEEIPKAQRMGEALVTHSPDWLKMNPASMNQWWNDVMQGRFWHATPNWRV